MTAARPLPDGPLIAFYGDDFTGSSASMEATAFAGIETVLFLSPPTPERLRAFGRYRAIGVAGVARAQTPAWMDRHLPPIFQLLVDTGAPVIHYKVCSTLLGAAYWQYWASRRHRRGDHRWMEPDDRCRSRDGPLPGDRQSVRGGA
jgi:hypothetical protein